MPKFKESSGFKMKGSTLYGKSPFKQVKGKDRPDPTWEGTDEYRKEKDIPATEYSARGVSKDKKKVDPDAPGTPGKPGYEPPVKRSDFDEGSKQQKMFDKNKAKSDAKKKKSKGKTKEQLLNEGFSQVEADQMMKTGATTGEQKSERKTAMSNNAKILQKKRKTKMSNNAKVLQEQRREQLKKSANKLAKKGLKEQLKEGASEFTTGLGNQYVNKYLKKGK